MGIRVWTAAELVKKVQAEDRKNQREFKSLKCSFVFMEFGYQITWDECDTPKKILKWVRHLCDKSWIDTRHLRAFIEAAIKHHGLNIHVST